MELQKLELPSRSSIFPFRGNVSHATENRFIQVDDRLTVFSGGPTASKASCEANQMKRIIEYDTYNRRICAPLLYFMFLIVERIKD
jgi:hypothetical protein